MHPSKIDELTANVRATNFAHAYANELRKRLMAYFAPLVGQKVIKADGTLLKKLVLPEFPKEDDFKQHPNDTVHVYKLSSDYSLGWTVKTCSTMPPHGCVYYEATVYIGEMGYGGGRDILTKLTPPSEDRRADYTVAEIMEKIALYEAAQKIADGLKSLVHPFDKFVR